MSDIEERKPVEIPLARKSPVTIQLKTPIGSQISLTFYPPKAKHLWNFKLKTNMDYELGELLEIASKISLTPVAIIEELEMEDIEQVIKVVSDFLSFGEEI